LSGGGGGRVGGLEKEMKAINFQSRIEAEKSQTRKLQNRFTFEYIFQYIKDPNNTYLLYLRTKMDHKEKAKLFFFFYLFSLTILKGK
jgi:hypothetical protein